MKKMVWFAALVVASVVLFGQAMADDEDECLASCEVGCGYYVDLPDTEVDLPWLPLVTPPSAPQPVAQSAVLTIAVTANPGCKWHVEVADDSATPTVGSDGFSRMHLADGTMMEHPFEVNMNPIYPHGGSPGPIPLLDLTTGAPITGTGSGSFDLQFCQDESWNDKTGTYKIKVTIIIVYDP